MIAITHNSPEDILDEFLLWTRGDIDLVMQAVMETSEVEYYRPWYWPFAKHKRYRVDWEKVATYIILYMKEQDQKDKEAVNERPGADQLREDSRI